MSRKKILLIILILSGLSSLFFLRSNTANEIPKDSISTGTAAVGLNNDFVSALIGVEKVVLDTNIFSSPVFESLVPSGAIIDQNPLRGRIDPFSKINSGSDDINTVNNDSSNSIPSTVDLGTPAQTSISSADFKITKITSTTATISLLGIPKGLDVGGSLIDENGNEIALPVFSYKIATNEYSYTATGLQSKKNYTIKLEVPFEYSQLQANFTTK